MRVGQVAAVAGGNLLQGDVRLADPRVLVFRPAEVGDQCHENDRHPRLRGSQCSNKRIITSHEFRNGEAPILIVYAPLNDHRIRVLLQHAFGIPSFLLA